MNKPAHTFIVTLRADAGEKAKRDYIKDAVTNLGGNFSPESPFFRLDVRDVSVSFSINKEEAAPVSTPRAAPKTSTKRNTP